MTVTPGNRFNIAPETKLWRYMSFAKFAALLHDKQLVLSPLHMFEDPFEGAGGKACNLDKLGDAIVDTFHSLESAKDGIKEMKACGLDKPVVYSKMNEQALFFFSRKQLHQMCLSALEGKESK